MARVTNIREIVREVSQHIAQTSNRTVKECLREGWVEQEPPLTDRFIGAVVEAMRGYKSKGITWNAKTLTDRARNSQESKYGADFVGILDIDLPEFKVRKGFLAQAKLLRGGNMATKDFKDLQDQCEKMLSLSPSSFVFLYSRDGIRIVPANEVLAVKGHSGSFDLSSLYSRNPRSFYEAHLECFIGDRGIHGPSEKILDQLKARTGLELSARLSGKK